jgi:hypothetical protein
MGAPVREGATCWQARGTRRFTLYELAGALRLGLQARDRRQQCTGVGVPRRREYLSGRAELWVPRLLRMPRLLRSCGLWIIQATQDGPLTPPLRPTITFNASRRSSRRGRRLSKIPCSLKESATLHPNRCCPRMARPRGLRRPGPHSSAQGSGKRPPTRQGGSARRRNGPCPRKGLRPPSAPR